MNMRRKPARRRYAVFTLAALLVGVGLLCVALGICHHMAEPFRTKLGAAKRFADRGATVRTIPGTGPWYLGLLYGDELFAEVIYLDLAGLDLDEADWDAIAVFSDLEFLGLQDTSFLDEWLPKLDAHPKLTHLDLSGTKLTEAGLKALSSRPNLRLLIVDAPLASASARFTKCDAAERRLYVARPLRDRREPYRQLSSVTDPFYRLIVEGPLKDVAPPAFLETCSLPSAVVFSDPTPECLAAAAALETIETITISGSFTNDSFRPIGECNHITFLDLARSSADDETLSLLARNPALTTLVLTTTSVTAKGIAHLCQIPGLSTVVLANTGITDGSLSAVGRIPRLQTLCLDYTKVTDRGLASLSSSPTLNVVSLYGVNVGDAGLLALPLSRMTRLDLSFTQVSDSFAQALSKSAENLTRLSVRGTAITNEGLAALTALSRLDYLDIGETDISDRGLADCGKWSDLKVLHLDGTGITDITVQRLTALPRLEQLDLSLTRVTDGALNDLLSLADRLQTMAVVGGVSSAGMSAIRNRNSAVEINSFTVKYEIVELPAYWQLEQRAPPAD